MAIKTQSIRGVSSNLITGTATLFYNKIGSIEPLLTTGALGTNKTFYPWAPTAGDNTWGAGVSSVASDTSAFAVNGSLAASPGTVLTEYWEVPAFLVGSTGVGESYAYTLEQAAVDASPATVLSEYLLTRPQYATLGYRHPYGTIGYTTNGMSITFTPEWGEIQVDQLLDAARIFKTGQTATLNTTIAEATLENLAVALAVPKSQYPTVDAGGNTSMELTAGNLYDCPTERSLVAVGPGKGGCATGQSVERVYTAYRALSQEAVTINMSRNDPQTYDVAFRLMPNDSGSYGRVVDRIIDAATQATPVSPYS